MRFLRSNVIIIIFNIPFLFIKYYYVFEIENVLFIKI